jgi:hypothetical protein
MRDAAMQRGERERKKKESSLWKSGRAVDHLPDWGSAWFSIGFGKKFKRFLPFPGGFCLIKPPGLARSSCLNSHLTISEVSMHDYS